MTVRVTLLVSYDYPFDKATPDDVNKPLETSIVEGAIKNCDYKFPNLVVEVDTIEDE